MTLDLTPRAKLKSQETALVPNLALQIDGVDTIFGAIPVKEFIRYGMPQVCYGEDYEYGGFIEKENSRPYISLESGGTSTSIKQQLRPDDGNTSSTGSMTIAILDVDNFVTKLISPGVEIVDMLGKKAKIWLGYDDTSFPEDYNVIHRGVIDDIVSGPGYIHLIVSHPDNKKRQQIYQKVDTEILGPIDSTQTTGIILGNVANTLQPVLGPDGTNDTSLTFYMRIEDEIVQYTGISGSGELTGVTRAVVDTLPNAHDAGAQCTSFYVLEGNCIDLALKLMLSGVNDFFVEDLGIRHFNQISLSQQIPNAIFFEDLNIVQEYGITAGDFITITGATNGTNNVVSLPVVTVAAIDDGTSSYVTVDEDTVTIINEFNSDAVASFRSKYDTLGEGLGMTPEEVDVPQHETMRDTFLQGFDYRFYLKDSVNGKEFIDKQVYFPYALYALPRKGKSSVNYTIGPVPGFEVKIFNENNILKPDQIKLRRRTHRFFYNTIVHSFDEDSIEEKFTRGQITTDETSKNRIRVGNQVNNIQAKGIRTDLGGEVFAANSATRMLGRYRFGAEHFERIQTDFAEGSQLEVGDVVIIEFVGKRTNSKGLQVSNTRDGDRERPAKFYEIVNKTLDVKSGKIEVSVVDTNQSLDERYGLVSPSSLISAVDPAGLYVDIEPSYGEIFGAEERQKWLDYVTRQEEVLFLGFDDQVRNRMLLDNFTTGTFVVGDTVDIADYPDETDPKVNEIYKNIHAHFSPQVAVVSGTTTTFDVGAGDIDKFFVGGTVEVHLEDYSVRSEERTVADITGTTVTVNEDLGFTPDSTYLVSFIGFADENAAYRYV
jgi:hypothetical protein